MVTERLEFRHGAQLRESLKKISIPISEYSFPNLYLFRELHRYEIITGKEIFVKGVSFDGYTFLMPTVEVSSLDLDYVENLLKTVDFLYPIPEEWLSVFDGERFSFTHIEGEMDYIYTVAKMSTYSGRRLHKKRNLIKQFVNTYSHDAAPLTREHRNHALHILNKWKDETGQEADYTDYYPCIEALQMSEELALCGVIFSAESEPAGFILGEELSGDTFVVRFAKAQKKFKGIYQYMFNSFANILPKTYKYLNFEQDLEKEQLRIAKSSYQPDHLLKKMRVSLRK
jgi:hypothetical protein